MGPRQPAFDGLFYWVFGPSFGFPASAHNFANFDFHNDVDAVDDLIERRATGGSGSSSLEDSTSFAPQSEQVVIQSVYSASHDEHATNRAMLVCPRSNGRLRVTV